MTANANRMQEKRMELKGQLSILRALEKQIGAVPFMPPIMPAKQSLEPLSAASLAV